MMHQMHPDPSTVLHSQRMSNVAAPARDFWPKTSRWTHWKSGQKYLRGVRWWSPRHHPFVSTLQLPSRGFDFRSSPIPCMSLGKRKLVLAKCSSLWSSKWVNIQKLCFFFLFDCYLHCKHRIQRRNWILAQAQTNQKLVCWYLPDNSQAFASFQCLQRTWSCWSFTAQMRQRQVKNATVILTLCTKYMHVHVFSNMCVWIYIYTPQIRTNNV